ncbi:MAG: glycosyltransferase family 39 protein [Acidobacteria bacterium]|nr:MAG: glycosyltransferase family 39 protein [Acidobacteriota bacterium]
MWAITSRRLHIVQGNALGLALLLGVLIAPYFVNLSGPSLWDSTEAFYAETPREMLELKSFVIPYFNYEPRLNKPPLAYWLVLPFYRTFGVSQVAERIVAALGAGALILLTFGLGAAMFNQWVGLLGAAIVATTPRLILLAQKSIIDITFTALIAAALALFWLAMRERESSSPRMTRRAPTRTPGRWAVIAFYATIGLGVLTKGPLAIVLVGGTIFFHLLIMRRWDLLRLMNIPVGLLVLAGVVLPWYVALYARLGWEPITSFIMRENIARFTSDIDWSRRGPFYYLSVLAGDFFPWSLYLIPAIVFGYRRWRQNDERSPTAFLFAWIAFILLFFSLAHNKHEYYILPLYPAAAILIARLFVHPSHELLAPGERRLMRVITIVVAVLFIAGGIVLGLIIARFFSGGWMVLLPLVVSLGGLWLLGQARLSRPMRLPLSLVGVMVVSALFYRLAFLPLIEPYRPIKPLCEAIAHDIRSEDLVGTYNVAAPSMVFYLRRRIFQISRPEEMRALLASHRRIFCVIPESEFHHVERLFPGQLIVWERRPMLTLRLNLLLERRANGRLPHVLLVSNRPREPGTNPVKASH